MNLADKIVALGVGKYYTPTETQSGGYSVPRNALDKLYVYTAHDFIHDWRVAGALIEKCEAVCIGWDALEPEHWRNMNHTADTPHAIIQICVEALEV